MNEARTSQSSPPPATVASTAPLDLRERFRLLLDDREPFLRLLPALLTLRLGIYFFGFVLFRMTSGGEPGFWTTLSTLWSRWDADHYVAIAEHGYSMTGPTAKDIVFFPLYPSLVALCHTVLPFVPTVFVAMLLSNAASLLGLRYLHRLAARRWDATVADRVVVYASLFPTAYFFLAAYTEGLFLLFVAAAFLFLDEERWLAAAMAGACASATRLSGILVAVAWLVHWVKKRGMRPTVAMWPLALAPAGFIAYLLLNQVVWHDPLRFLVLQRTVWHHRPAMPWDGLAAVLDYAASSARDLRAFWYRDVPEVIAAVAGYLGSIVVVRRIGLAEGLYCLGSVVFWTSNEWWMSGPRFCLVLVPLFLYMGSRKLPGALHHAIWAASAVAQLALANAFVLGAWAF
jgi:hypothetical protein